MEKLTCVHLIKSHAAGMQTTLGLIQIFLNEETKSLAIKQPSDIKNYFGIAKLDSLCRQMGFSKGELGNV